jgi:hypothetical protein
MISHLLSCLFIGTIFVYMLEKRFPVKFQKFSIYVSYNSIYYFSKLQIFFVNMKTSINKIIEDNPSLLKIKQKIETLLSREETEQVSTRYVVKNSKLYYLSDTNGANPDFIILSWLSDDKKCANKKIIYNKIDDMFTNDNSDVKFLMIEFKIGDNKTFKIDLKTEHYNYYIVGNKFTKDFFIFYINHYLQFNANIKDTEKCSLRLIDNDVKKVELNFTDKNDSIVLGKNEYKVIITNDNE